MSATLSGYQLLETLHAGSKTVIYRGRREKDNASVIVKTILADHPTLEEIARLRHEYQIIETLHIPGIIKPYELKHYQHGLALVLEYVPGCSLKDLIAHQDTNLISFLNIAIHLAQILGELHAQKIIHKDIKPHNILINPDTGEVKLIDFSISSRLDKENPTLSNPNILEGTLAYMSPEQTGRMNRAIDYRTDFYSLGVTLYEMLTGTLPFQAIDPMELVHCHIAKTPAAPCKETVCRVLSEVPDAISAVILKLLAKTAEERYQSAWGLKADLEECLFQLQTTGAIANFVPGRRDKSGQFLIPQRLYGREVEVAALMAAFARVAEGSSEMVLVSGYSGIGKTSVVNEVHKPIVGARGYFITGKFDQFKRHVPYASLIQAFKSLIQQLLTEGAVQIQFWKEKLLAALGESGQVIIEVIPEVELMIGTQPAVPQLGATEAQNRFNRVFQQFISVFTTEDHPLVIFLDDLQWADSASLNLIELLITNPDSQYLLLIGAYRDNEVSPTHPLVLSLDKVKIAGAVLNNIVLAPLQLTDVEALVSDTLNDAEQSQPLAELLLHKTGGNPFFLTQLLKTLYQEDLLTYDFESGTWQWDIQHIQAIGLTDLNVVELTARNIRKLPLETQQVLKLAACIGNTFNLEVLAIVNQGSPLTTATQLWSALQAGLILPLSQDYKIPLVFRQEEAEGIALTDVKVDYKFLHDRVQQAAYSLIPDAARKATHLKIGQLLLQSITPEDRKENIFALVNQLNYGMGLLTSEPEQYELAELNLIAGQRAKAATAYESAVKYLNVGLELLPANSWKSQYDLTLELYVETTEVEYLNSNFERAAILAEVVLEQAASLLDSVRVYELQIQFCLAQSEMLKAIALALHVLELLGVSLLSMPSESETRPRLPQLENLDDIPVMTDPVQLAALRILMIIIPPTFIAAPNTYVQVVLTMANLCAEYGYSAIAAFVYCQYGLVLSGILGEVEAGYQSGKLALRLLEKFKANELKCKIYMVFNTFIKPWKEPVSATTKPMLEGFLSGMETGDIEWAGYNASYYCDHLFFSGESLEVVASEQAKYFAAITRQKHTLHLDCINSFRRAVLKLLDRAETEYILNDKKVTDEIVLQELILSKNYMCAFTHYVAKVMLAYLLKDYSVAIANAESAVEYAGSAVNQVVTAIHNFYFSLSLLAQMNSFSETEQASALAQVIKNQDVLRNWAVHAPCNFQHKYELVEAEKARFSGQSEKAMDYYERAIRGAKEQKFIQEEALANELAAEFYLTLGREKVAKTYMMDAYYGYIHWGAKVKIEDLTTRHPQLITRSPYPDKQDFYSPELTQTSSTTTGGPQILDLMTVMKASRILSEEMVLNRLLETMMKVVIENAGAQQGYFITHQDHQWILEAAGKVAEKDIQVWTAIDHPEDETDSPLLPIALFNYVERIKDSLVLDDATKDVRFMSNAYIATRQPKSILCLPLIHAGQFTGILYLENNLISGVFTPERVNVLNLLSAQISIAIDNARLYTNLQAYSQELAAKNKALQASEAREREKAEQLEQHVYKLQQTQAQLVQTEKVSSLGQLVAGVAHEVNNPVSFINGNLHHATQYVQDLVHHLELYQQHLSQPPAEIVKDAEEIELDFLLEDLPKMLNSMKLGTDRIKDIMQSLRNFSRTDTDHKKPADLHLGIDSTLMILQHRLKAKAELKAINVMKEYGDLPLVECYAGSLNQVFMNILANAIDALEEERKTSEKAIQIRTEITDAGVIIRIRDNGVGMTEEVRQRLFDAFFTTKPEGQGTGLGLSISHQIVVEKHGGQLTCTSVLGGGTEFVISIPCC